jgi:hypothetical protein
MLVPQVFRIRFFCVEEIRRHAFLEPPRRMPHNARPTRLAFARTE